MSHIIAPLGELHGPLFKAIKTRWLREFGLVPVYSRAYVKALLSLDGLVLWKRTWKKQVPYEVGDRVGVVVRKKERVRSWQH